MDNTIAHIPNEAKHLKRKCKIGMFNALLEIKGVSQNQSDLQDFEDIFEKYHTHILFQRITYYHTEFGNRINDDIEPFVIIETIGSFDNLVNFAKCLHNEISSFLPSKEYDSTEFTCSIMLFGNDRMCIDCSNNYEKKSYCITFIKNNQESPDYYTEGLKFNISL